MTRRTNRSGLGSGFTLIEVVLAIGLASIVFYLLTSAIEMYLLKLNTSRARVETAQIARAILDRMAADIESARLFAPQPIQGIGPQSGGGVFGGGSSAGNATMNGGADSSTSAPAGGVAGGAVGFSNPVVLQGIAGTSSELQIDVAAPFEWSRALPSPDSPPVVPTAPEEMPHTVRYLVQDGKWLDPGAWAAIGLDEERVGGVAGLYRESVVTAALAPSRAANTSSPSTSATSTAGASTSTTSLMGFPDAVADQIRRDLLAPEAATVKFAYFDGKELRDSWDSVQAGGLPLGIEIRLQLVEIPVSEGEEPDTVDKSRRASGQFRENEIVEFRRFVRLGAVLPARAATPLLMGALGGGPANASAQGEQGNNASGEGQQPNNSGGGNDDAS